MADHYTPQEMLAKLVAFPTVSRDSNLTLVDWVEEGSAPDRLIGARVVQGEVVRTRPLCPYPQVARYKGTGSIDDAANFECVAPGAAR